jgi:hypothetical protein
MSTADDLGFVRTSTINGVSSKYALQYEVFGLNTKGSVTAATTEPLPEYTYDNGEDGVGATYTAVANGALPAIDNVNFTGGERLLIKNELSGENNGIVDVLDVGGVSSPWSLRRSVNFNSSSNITDGSFVNVRQGDTYADQYWQLITNGTITVGTTALEFKQFSGGRNSKVVTFADTDFVDGVLTIPASSHGFSAPFDTLSLTKVYHNIMEKTVGVNSNINPTTGVTTITVTAGDEFSGTATFMI